MSLIQDENRWMEEQGRDMESALSQVPAPCTCSATLPARGSVTPHQCKLEPGHTGWHTCRICDFNWVTQDNRTMDDGNHELPN